VRSALAIGEMAESCFGSQRSTKVAVPQQAKTRDERFKVGKKRREGSREVQLALKVRGTQAIH
jgi:hypothetical protein